MSMCSLRIIALCSGNGPPLWKALLPKNFHFPNPHPHPQAPTSQFHYLRSCKNGDGVELYNEIEFYAKVNSKVRVGWVWMEKVPRRFI